MGGRGAGACEGDSLLLATGELVRYPGRVRGGAPDQLEQLGHPVAPTALGARQPEGDVVRNVQGREQCPFLWDEPACMLRTFTDQPWPNTVCSPNRTVPPLGLSNPAMRRSRVVLPQPDSLSSAVSEPGTCRSTPSSTRVRPKLLCTSRAVSVLTGAPSCFGDLHWIADAPEVPPDHCPARLTRLTSNMSSAGPGGYPGASTVDRAERNERRSVSEPAAASALHEGGSPLGLAARRLT